MAAKRKYSEKNQKITAFFASCSSSTSDNVAEEELDPISATKRAKHRGSGFNPAWQEEFPWLLYTNSEKDGPSMFCTLCQKYNQVTKRKSWIEIPCCLFRRDKIREHQRSKCHLDSVQAESLAASAKVTGGIKSAIQNQVTVQRMALISALKCLYWLAKQEIAHHTKFSSLLELGKSIGCPYLGELEVAKNANYTSHMMIDEFLDVISGCIESNILRSVNESSVVGILCDESTDAANLKQMVIFVKILVPGSTRVTMTHFLKVVSLQDGKANTIEQSLLKVCQTCNIPLNKIFGFGSDGAAVMVGRLAGVATKLKGHNPEMISIHCGAHKLALASSQAANKVPYLKKFDSHLVALFYFFKNSPVREAALHNIQEVVEDPVLCLKRAVYTRWLSHDQAVASIRRTLTSLLTTLEREASENEQPVAHGLLLSMKTYRFVATIHFLSDLLPILTTLSLVFQQERVNLTIVQPQVNATIASLKLLISQPGPHMKNLDSVLSDLGSQFGMTFTERDEQSFQKGVKEKYIDALVENLEDRFSDIGVVSIMATLLDPRQASLVQQSSLSQFNEYGTSELRKLADHFTVSADLETLQLEWMGLKQVLVQDTSTLSKMSSNEVLQTLASHQTLSQLYPTFTKLASIALILPISTADCERGFSTLKRIKNPLRNRLKTDTLDKLIRISSEGPDLDTFDFDHAASIWAARSKRKLSI